MIKEICKNLDTAAKSVDKIDYTVVLRGDSTLRGHFPEARMTCFSSVVIINYDNENYASIWKMTRLLLQEPDAVTSVLGEMDAWIICPFFLQGGRYTINDTHFVADSELYVFPFITKYRD